MSEEKKLNGTVIVTYRCNARCSMCNRYKAPSKPEEEISIETIKKLPKMYFTNITGGEPFIRTDLKDIVQRVPADRYPYLYRRSGADQQRDSWSAERLPAWLRHTEEAA